MEYNTQELRFPFLAKVNDTNVREFASDCELDNSQNLQFHLNVGFEEANRIICFTKKI